jgi:hypothetical protein
MLVTVGVLIARKVESLANITMLRVPTRSGVRCDSNAGRCVRVTRCSVRCTRGGFVQIVIGHTTRAGFDKPSNSHSVWYKSVLQYDPLLTLKQT